MQRLRLQERHHEAVGAFLHRLQTIFDFIIVAAAIFIAVKAINRLKRKEAVAPIAPPPPSKQELLLEEIRDLLKQQRQ